jgi:Sulfotransferase domain
MATLKNLFLTIVLFTAFSPSSTLTQPQVFITSIPKCGTHLLCTCVQLISKQNKREWCKRFTLLNEQQILNSKAFTFASHAYYNSKNNALIKNKPWKALFIYRDPRDQIVSMAHWIYKNGHKHNRLMYTQMSMDDLLFELIERNAPVYTVLFDGKEIKNMRGIGDFYALYMPWLNHPDVYTTNFEALVGPQGGGTTEQQLTEIMNIARHIGMPITQEEAISVAEHLFGNTATFHEGQIGSWKKYFNKEHKKAFKKKAGQLLIDLGYEKDLNW